MQNVGGYHLRLRDAQMKHWKLIFRDRFIIYQVEKMLFECEGKVLKWGWDNLQREPSETVLQNKTKQLDPY